MEQSAATVIPVTPEQQAAVEALLHQPTLSPRLRERLAMVKAAGLGWKWGAIAAWSGRSERTARHWLMRFASDGIPALADAPRPGRPPIADASYHAALDDLAERDPRALGLPSDAWTSARLSASLAETTGVQIAPEQYELHYQDETHVETNSYLAKQWHRIGRQQRIASVGVNRGVDGLRE
jgi:transposase